MWVQQNFNDNKGMYLTHGCAVVLPGIRSILLKNIALMPFNIKVHLHIWNISVKFLLIQFGCHVQILILS